MPDDIKDIFYKLKQELQRDIVYTARRDDNIALLGLYKRGMRVIKLKPEKLHVFRERSKNTWNRLKGKLYPAWLLDELLREIEIYRSMNNPPKNN